MAWVKIQDVTLGSQLFNGSEIYCFVRNINISGGNNIGNTPIQGTESEIKTSLDGSGLESLGSNFNRRCGYNSYSSFNNPNLVLSGGWTEETGSTISSGSNHVLTPFKLWRMVHSDHQFLLKGGIIIPNLVAGETGSGYYTSRGGLPFVFTQPWQMEEDYPRGNTYVTWTATLRIDKEEM